MNLKLLRNEMVLAESGDKKACTNVLAVLAPRKEDTPEQVAEKIRIFMRLIAVESMKYDDAQFHRDIDLYFAEQVVSYLALGVPKYKLTLIEGFRESAKTTRMKFCLVYLQHYLPDVLDYTSIVSADGTSSSQMVVDFFNIFSLSRLPKYFKKIVEKPKKDEQKASHSMSKFTTTTGVTYRSSSARQTTRGLAQIDISGSGGVETKRPKVLVFDDIENENTINSFAATQQIRHVMASSMDGLDQTTGFTLIIGNTLSIRGNIHYYRAKADKVISIPLVYSDGTPTWSAKYVLTDAEVALSPTPKVSVEGIKRKSTNYEAEYLLTPSRLSVYFPDTYIAGIDESTLIGDEDRVDGLLTIELPEKNATYIIPVDTAKGNGGDHSSFVVLKTSGATFTEVANFSSNTIRPEDYANVVVRTAREYNNAMIIPENNYPGNEMIVVAKDIYTNIFVNDKREMGVNTNMKSKPEMFLKAKLLLRDKLATIRSRRLYTLLLEYPLNAVEGNGESVINRDSFGGHFDMLMAWVIGVSQTIGISESVDNEAIDRLLARATQDVMQNQGTHR